MYTSMAFAGIRRPEERADVVAYLATLADNPRCEVIVCGAALITASLGVLVLGILLDQREITDLAPPEVYEGAVYSEAIDQVAARLGNTPTICRKCYIHPAVIAAFEFGSVGT